MTNKLKDMQVLAKSQKDLQKRIEALRGKIKALSERELAKAAPVLVQPNSNTVSSGIEGKPPGNLNPKGIDKMQKGPKGGWDMSGLGGGGAPSTPPPQPPPPQPPPPMPAGAMARSDMGKAEKCMKCGHMHMKLDKCGEVTKSDLIDEKGKQSSNSDVTPFKDGAKVKAHTQGSGGVTLPGSKLKKALTAGMASGAPSTLVNQLGKEELSKPAVSEAQRRAMGAAASGKSKLDIPKKVGKEFINKDPGGKLPEVKKDMSSPPMAKPPKAKAPPAISPGVKKNVAEAYKNPQVPAESIKKPSKDLKNSELEKGLMSDVAHKESAAMGAPAPKVTGPAKMPSPGDHAQRAQEFAGAQAGAFKPAGPVVSGLSLDKPKLASPKAAGIVPKAAPKAKPGIFAKLGAKLGL